MPQLRIAPAFDCVVSIYQAKGVLRDLIHGSSTAATSPSTGIYRFSAGSDARLRYSPPDWLVPVPLHPTRFRERGFNQAAALAEAVSERACLPVLKCIERRLYTKTQTRFDRMERMQNLRNAFALRKNSNVRGKHLVLLDDVLTTGSTLHECALVLRAAGAESVRALTVARS